MYILGFSHNFILIFISFSYQTMNCDWLHRCNCNSLIVSSAWLFIACHRPSPLPFTAAQLPIPETIPECNLNNSNVFTCHPHSCRQIKMNITTIPNNLYPFWLPFRIAPHRPNALGRVSELRWKGPGSDANWFVIRHHIGHAPNAKQSTSICVIPASHTTHDCN